MDSLFRLAAPQWTLLKDPARLRALSACGIFATRPESEFDDLVRLAARVCQARTAMIAFADGQHLHFKSTFGATKPLLASIAESFFIPTVQQTCFHWTNSSVRQSPVKSANDVTDTINFFAGVSLSDGEDQTIGILCVTDRRPRSISVDQLEALLALGRQTERMLKLRRLITEQTDLIADRNSEIEIRTLSELRLASALSRVSLINEIGKSARSGADPEAILKTAVNKLGTELAADRCYFVTYSLADDVGSIRLDWCAEGFTSIAGDYKMSEYPYNREESFLNGQTSVVEDVLKYPISPGAVRSNALGLRSMIRAPIQQNGRMTALTVAMATPRNWTEDEIALVETVAAQTRAAVETASHNLHERALLRDVLASVTEGKLILADSPSQLPPCLTPYGEPVILDKDGGLSLLRELIRGASVDLNHGEIRSFDLMTAASEAGMNAIVHADTGVASVFVSADGIIQVRIEDRGSGIAFDDLPKATLSRGFSTKQTLGHGLKMILETIDRLYLVTGPSGTIVILEQDKTEPLPSWLNKQHQSS